VGSLGDDLTGFPEAFHALFSSAAELEAGLLGYSPSERLQMLKIGDEKNALLWSVKLSRGFGTEKQHCHQLCNWLLRKEIVHSEAPIYSPDHQNSTKHRCPRPEGRL
jgi:hypothetical protein